MKRHREVVVVPPNTLQVGSIYTGTDRHNAFLLLEADLVKWDGVHHSTVTTGLHVKHTKKRGVLTNFGQVTTNASEQSNHKDETFRRESPVAQLRTFLTKSSAEMSHRCDAALAEQTAGNQVTPSMLEHNTEQQQPHNVEEQQHTNEQQHNTEEQQPHNNEEQQQDHSVPAASKIPMFNEDVLNFLLGEDEDDDPEERAKPCHFRCLQCVLAAPPINTLADLPPPCIEGNCAAHGFNVFENAPQHIEDQLLASGLWSGLVFDLFRYDDKCVIVHQSLYSEHDSFCYGRHVCGDNTDSNECGEYQQYARKVGLWWYWKGGDPGL